jgi:hypothetical protein
MTAVPSEGSVDWYGWGVSLTDVANHVEAIVYHDGTTGGGTRPTGYVRVRWVGGTNRPLNMAVGDIWEHDV